MRSSDRCARAGAPCARFEDSPEGRRLRVRETSPRARHAPRFALGARSAHASMRRRGSSRLGRRLRRALAAARGHDAAGVSEPGRGGPARHGRRLPGGRGASCGSPRGLSASSRGVGRAAGVSRGCVRADAAPRARARPQIELSGPAFFEADDLLRAAVRAAGGYGYATLPSELEANAASAAYAERALPAAAARRAPRRSGVRGSPRRRRAARRRRGGNARRRSIRSACAGRLRAGLRRLATPRQCGARCRVATGADVFEPARGRRAASSLLRHFATVAAAALSCGDARGGDPPRRQPGPAAAAPGRAFHADLPRPAVQHRPGAAAPPPRDRGRSRRRPHGLRRAALPNDRPRLGGLRRPLRRLPRLPRAAAARGAPPPPAGRHALPAPRPARVALLQGAPRRDLRPRVLPERDRLGLRLRRAHEAPLAGEARHDPRLRQGPAAYFFDAEAVDREPYMAPGLADAENAPRGASSRPTCGGTRSSRRPAARRPATRPRSRSASCGGSSRPPRARATGASTSSPAAARSAPPPSSSAAGRCSATRAPRRSR